MIADPVVRNRGTIGGALCQADPSEDLSAVCAAVGARMVIRGADGERVLGMPEFQRGPYQTAVAQTEILIEIRVPLREGSGSAYEKVDRRVGDWAVAAAGASVQLAGGTIERAGIALAAVGGDIVSTEAQEALVGRAAVERAVRTRRRARRRGVLAGDRPAGLGRVQAARRRRPHGARAAARDRAGARRGGVMHAIASTNTGGLAWLP